MNKKTDEKKKKDEVKKLFMRAVSSEEDGKLTKDQWLRVLTEAGIKKSTYVLLFTAIEAFSHTSKYSPFNGQI